jgi:hypothetical protein
MISPVSRIVCGGASGSAILRTGWTPGRPSSITNDFAVTAGRLVTVTWSTVRKSARISVGLIVVRT